MLSLAERSAEPSAKLGFMAGLLGRQFENENNHIILDQFQKILHAIVEKKNLFQYIFLLKLSVRGEREK